MVEQKRSGPSGSPCCGPSSDIMTCYSKNKNDGCEYDDRQKAYNMGKRSLIDSSMSDLCKLLNMLVKSSLTRHTDYSDTATKTLQGHFTQSVVTSESEK